MARPKSNGPYAPLSATYYRDDAILEVGESGELLFVRCLAFLADASSDGFITERQMKVVVGMGLKNVPARIASLLEVGLIENVDGGYIVRSWLKWNKSTDDIGKHLKRDRERKASGTVKDSARIPGGIQTESVRIPGTNTVQVNTDQSNVTAAAEIRPDVSRICDLLADLIETNGSKRPVIGKAWTDAARLMIDTDKRPLGEIVALIQWCQKSAFWRANILSMSKFREKYDQLRLQRDTTPVEPERAPVLRIRAGQVVS